jgi:hypothetical protein
VKSLDWESRNPRKGRMPFSTLSSWLRRVIRPGGSTESQELNVSWQTPSIDKGWMLDINSRYHWADVHGREANTEG